MRYVEAQLNSRRYLVDVLPSGPGSADEIELQLAFVYVKSGSNLNHNKDPSPSGRGEAVRESWRLEHQSVDLVDHSGSRPEVRFGEAVERSFHQLIGISQRGLIR